MDVDFQMIKGSRPWCICAIENTACKWHQEACGPN